MSQCKTAQRAGNAEYSARRDKLSAPLLLLLQVPSATSSFGHPKKTEVVLHRIKRLELPGKGS